ncbi:MAG TPA: hypothetical protein VGN98_03240 [Tianweitania sediminis]|jgi:hypothetical protein|nr:hypothetical protein [Tianweitania sediminis]
MADYPQADADLLNEVGPEDMPNGGHRTYFFPLLLAARAFANYVRDVATELAGIAEQVSEDAASAAAGSGSEATAAQIRSGAAAQYLSVRRVLEANQPVALTRATTTNWDMAAGINFDLLLDGNVTTLANPTNQVAGKSGVLRIRQDATGGRTLSAYGSNFKWLGGQPALPTGANRVAMISYLVWASGTVYLTYGGDA